MSQDQERNITISTMTVLCRSDFVITAILNLGQDVEEDWPLFVKDNKGEDHAVSFIINISLALAPVDPVNSTD